MVSFYRIWYFPRCYINLWNTCILKSYNAYVDLLYYMNNLNQKYQNSSSTSFLLIVMDSFTLQFHITRRIIKWTQSTKSSTALQLDSPPCLHWYGGCFYFLVWKWRNSTVIFSCVWPRELRVNFQCGVSLSKCAVISQAKTIQHSPLSHNNWSRDPSIE